MHQLMGGVDADGWLEKSPTRAACPASWHGTRTVSEPGIAWAIYGTT